MNDTTTPVPDPEKTLLLYRLEPYVRNGLIGIFVATGLLLVGQYTGASSVASVMQKERMDIWASRSPAHKAAMAEYLACSEAGPELTKQACIARAATGQLATDLAQATATPVGVVEALPAPLRWFLY